MDDEHSEIKIVASVEEHKLITTNPDELLEQKKGYLEADKVLKQPVRAKKPSVTITIDEKKGFYNCNGLKPEEIRYLLGEGYIQSRHWNILGKREQYLLKPRRGESLEHFFLIQDIAEYLKPFTDSLELFETTKPDIVFSKDNKKYAVEVETGTVYKTFKKQLLEKVEKLNQDYQKNWFFVVTNEKIAPKYNKLGRTFTRKSLGRQFEKWLKKT